MSVSQGHTDSNDSSEWEYEYDEQEKESFLITVEFPPDSAVGTSAIGRGGRRRGETHENLGKKAPQPIHDNEIEQRNLFATGNSDGETNQYTSDQQALQIFNLASTNPIISRNGQIFSCSWGRTSGTDILFSTVTSLESPERIAYIGDKYGVIGSSRLKLLARPAFLQPRRTAGLSLPDNELAFQTVSDTQTFSGGLDRDLGIIGKNTTKIGEEPSSSTDAFMISKEEKPHSRLFLDKFAGARRRRGQTDPILVRSGMHEYFYNGTSGSVKVEKRSADLFSDPSTLDNSLEANGTIEARGYETGHRARTHGRARGRCRRI